MLIDSSQDMGNNFKSFQGEQRKKNLTHIKAEVDHCFEQFKFLMYQHVYEFNLFHFQAQNEANDSSTSSSSEARRDSAASAGAANSTPLRLTSLVAENLVRPPFGLLARLAGRLLAWLFLWPLNCAFL